MQPPYASPLGTSGNSYASGAVKQDKAGVRSPVYVMSGNLY